MILVDHEKCQGCGICVKNCPLEAVRICDGIARTGPDCVQCGVCLRLCPFGAVSCDSREEAGSVTCLCCPVRCRIPEGRTGACRRFINRGGTLLRSRPPEPRAKKHPQADPRICEPLITAVGAGSTYPDSVPAPHIVCETRDGVDVVTVVTEAPLSYSSVTVKLDTDAYIGREGEGIYRGGKLIGMVNTEEFGCKMLTIGGTNRLISDGGFMAVRTMAELANGDEVEVRVGKSTLLRMQRGHVPAVNGRPCRKMRPGCGSGAVGLFAHLMKDRVDECIVLDHHIVGLVSEHPAGAAVGLSWSGVTPRARKASPGRYYCPQGSGVGGTALLRCRDAIAAVDMSIARAGQQILVTTTLGDVSALFEIQNTGDVKEIPMTAGAGFLADTIAENCEEASCSVLFVGGCGGSARAGVCRKPLALNEAVHQKKAMLTIGGAPVYILPGGGINFMADTEEMIDRAFTWVPAPAAVAPIEYTLRLEDYEAIGGHLSQLEDAVQLKKKWEENNDL